MDREPIFADRAWLWTQAVPGALLLGVLVYLAAYNDTVRQWLFH